MPKNPFIPVVVAAVVILASYRTSAQPGEGPTPPGAGPAAAGATATPDAAGKAGFKPAPPPEPPTEAERLLDDAIKKVAGYASVIADLIQRVEMLDQKFEIVGKYRKAPKDRLYLQLEVKNLPDASGKMLQVCNGTTFWEFQQVFETQIYRRLEAGPILEKLRSSDLESSFRESVLTQLGFAGPDMLLTGLRQRIKFDQKEKGTLNDKPVWIIRGNWKSHEGLLGPNSQPLSPIANLPSYIPSLVTIYLGEEDLWPYKITMVGQKPSVVFEDTRPIGPDGRRIGSMSSIQKPLLTKIQMEYQGVKLNVPVPEDEFVFQAPQGASVEDKTKEILDLLEKAATMRAAQKKAEASGDDATLNQTIPVPKAAPSSEPPPALPGGAPAPPK